MVCENADTLIYAALNGLKIFRSHLRCDKSRFMSSRQYWIGVASKAHVQIGLTNGIAQLNHGKEGPLKRMRPGDGFVYYSPKTDYPKGEQLQTFTAIGRVRDGEVFQVQQYEGFHPFRREVDYFLSSDAPIRPLLDSLTFIKNKQHWGATFRLGFLRIPEEDFALIANAMGRTFTVDFADGAPKSF